MNLDRAARITQNLPMGRTATREEDAMATIARRCESGKGNDPSGSDKGNAATPKDNTIEEREKEKIAGVARKVKDFVTKIRASRKQLQKWENREGTIAYRNEMDVATASKQAQNFPSCPEGTCASKIGWD